MSFSVKAFAKINLTLDITGIRRGSGYHELDMLMQTVSLCDTLRFEPSDGLELLYGDRRVELADGQQDLVIRAALLLAREAGIAPTGRVTLTKLIPSMAGLGGGSSDCAAALRGFCRLWDLRVPGQDLKRIALSLGSDVPFFLTGGTCRVRGIGEETQKLPDLPAYRLLLSVPRPGLSTPSVYRAYDALEPLSLPPSCPAAYERLCAGDIAGAFAASRNDLERAGAALSDGVARALAGLKTTGSAFVRMTGSGSAVYALFPAGCAPLPEAPDAFPASFVPFSAEFIE